MNQNIKQLWLKSLRSGEYQQTKHMLRDDESRNRFCCLGVLCDLHSKETGVNWSRDNIGHYSYGDSEATLPNMVVVWAGLLTFNPIVRSKYHADDILSAVNDRGTSFEEIANIIEEQL